MATDYAIRSVTNTLTSTTADTVTLNQPYDAIEVTNHDSTTTLYVRWDGAMAVSEADNTTPVLPASSKVIRVGVNAAGTVVVSVVGNGNKYTIEGVG